MSARPDVGTWIHATCMQPTCDNEWDVFVPAGRAFVNTCEPCFTALVAAFWQVWREES